MRVYVYAFRFVSPVCGSLYVCSCLSSCLRASVFVRVFVMLLGSFIIKFRSILGSFWTLFGVCLVAFWGSGAIGAKILQQIAKKVPLGAHLGAKIGQVGAQDGAKLPNLGAKMCPRWPT